jgi:cation diffusion facilitator CzcD-associated flavoprotein CzcO
MLIVGVAAVVLAGVSVAIGATGLAIVGSGASAVNRAAEATTVAEAQLEVVLDRQEALAPQLAGGQMAGVEALKAQSAKATTLEARLEAANVLSTGMAEAFGKLPPPGDEATAQIRMNLQYELVGAQNRITAEQRRYEEGVALWRNAASGLSGGLAVGLGLAPAPPER